MNFVSIRLAIIAIVLAITLTMPEISWATQPGVVVANTGGRQTAQFHSWQIFRKNVDEDGDGTLLLDYLIYGELGSGPSMLEAVTSGRAMIAGIGCAGVTASIPELAIPQMPYLFSSDEEFDFVFDHYMTPIFSEILAARGLVLLQWTDNGWMDIYTREPVQSPEQLANRQIRTVSNIVGPAFLQSIKAVPVDIGVSDLASSSQADKIFGGFGVLSTYGRVQANFKYLTITHHIHNCGMVVANKAWFDSATSHEQQVLRSAYPSLKDMRTTTEDGNKAILSQVAAAGATILQLSPAQRNAWAAAALPLYPLIQQMAGGRSSEVYERIRQGKQAFLREPGSNPKH